MDDMKKDYSTKWVKMKVLSLGGKWGYAVGIVKDFQNIQKVRIVKGKLSQPFPKSPEWKEVDLSISPEPISQVQKMNFKRLDEFTSMLQIVTDMFKTLEEE